MNKQGSTISTPVWLISIAVILLLARIVVWYMETYQPQEALGINWTEPSKIDLSGREYQSKLVLYYFTAEGSEACRAMNSTSLLNKNVVKLVNEEFLPIKVENKLNDEETEVGKLHRELQQKYMVFTLPVLVATLPDGKEVETQNAYAGVSAKQVLRFLERCQKREGYERGIDYLAHRQYAEAARSFEYWLRLVDNTKRDSTDGALYCALSYYMLNQDKNMHNILEPVLRTKQFSSGNRWPKPLAEFMLGELDAEGLIKAADRESNREPRMYYFIAMHELKAGNTLSAIENFKLAQKGTFTSSEVYVLAEGQLNAMNVHQ